MLNPLKVELRSLNISGDKSAAIMIHVWFVIQNFFGNGIKSNRNEAVSGLFHVGRCVCVTILSDLIRAVKFVRLFASEPESVAVFIKPKDFRTDSSKKKSIGLSTDICRSGKKNSKQLALGFLSFLSFFSWFCQLISIYLLFFLYYSAVLIFSFCFQQTVCSRQFVGGRGGSIETDSYRIVWLPNFFFIYNRTRILL